MDRSTESILQPSSPLNHTLTSNLRNLQTVIPHLINLYQHPASNAHQKRSKNAQRSPRGRENTEAPLQPRTELFNLQGPADRLHIRKELRLETLDAYWNRKVMSKAGGAQVL